MQAAIFWLTSKVIQIVIFNGMVFKVLGFWFVFVLDKEDNFLFRVPF